MSSDNFSDAVEGLTKGLLNWSAEKISSFVQKLKERKLGFIEERKTIEVVKEQYKSGEIIFYSKYIQDKEILFLIKLGLTLRRLEDDDERLQNLRNKIYNKYGAKGLHVAQFVQNGVLNRYFGLLLEKLISEEDLKEKVQDVLSNIEKYTLFVSGNSKIIDIVRKVTTIIDAHSPSIFVIAGLRSATKIVSEAIIPLGPLMEDYESEKFSSHEKEIIIFKLKLNVYKSNSQ